MKMKMKIGQYWRSYRKEYDVCFLLTVYVYVELVKVIQGHADSRFMHKLS